MEKEFSRWKKQCLKKLDLSKKGSVDEDISHLVSLINSRERFFTTSSCSGRIILIDRVSGISDIQKQNCHWLFVSHQKCKPDDLISALERSNGDAVFKFEPFVLHVQCRQLDDAQMMHSVAINAGFRNSGLTVGKLGKIMMAVRSTHVLEVPLSHNGKVLVEQEYIHFLTELANQKMEENLRRIQRLISALERSNGDAVFKFEPFVLHVQCRQLDDAQMMHSVAINAGFRNSGLTVGKLGKIMMAVRSTHVLEVPLSHNGKVLVEQEYIHFLTELANQKMEENLRRIQRLV
ncbi:tRNA wybutosine-synthesizing protein 3 -like protein [Takifugu flavidus]|uniref:tRNA wybutosine-synthesizing protein 3 homolog n=1 Tax=Takifugu flavidus TaxID=433684 RepID=A0A5C6P2H0_9TELE|nr:tRNA wybutosine-synthesizing protein 3 -like protein [Takifugu flavidus]